MHHKGMKRISAAQLWAGREFRVETWKDGKPHDLHAGDDWTEALAAYERECAARPTEHITLRHRLYLHRERNPGE